MATIADRGAGWSGGAGRQVGGGALGAARRPSPVGSRRRRAVLAGAVSVTVVSCLALGGGLGRGSSGQPASTGAIGSTLVMTRLYVVKPGDTLWGIATSLAGNGDPRPIMQRLERQVPSGMVVVGQRLVLAR